MLQREIITPDMYLDLSAQIAYRLSGQAFDPRTVLDVILTDSAVGAEQERIFAQGIKVIHTGYGDMRRKMGPLSVIHPLRASALLRRIVGTLDDEPRLLTFLNLFMHDKGEDLTRAEIGDVRFDLMEAEMEVLNRMLTPEQRWLLAERHRLLTIQPGQEYTDYLVHILAEAQRMPDLILTKLADRLDNSLDIRVTRHGIPGQGAFGTVFDLLFLPTFRGQQSPTSYVPLVPAEVTQILANLFKNTEFLNLMRTEGCFVSHGADRLIDSILFASSRIARGLVQDTLAALPVASQRAAVNDVLNYCQKGGIDAIRSPDPSGLDGMFIGVYGTKEGRKARLKAMVEDKEFLARVAMVFMALYANFQTDPGFMIRGIDRHGVRAVV
jgi:hypothetical protein